MGLPCYSSINFQVIKGESTDPLHVHQSEERKRGSHPLHLLPFPPRIMPVSPTALPHQQDHYPQPQVKLCSSCRSPLSQDLDPSHFFPDSDVNDHLMLCRPCRERSLLQTIQQQSYDLLSYHDVDDEFRRLHPHPTHGVGEDPPRALTISSPVLEPAAIIEASSPVPPPSSFPPADRPLPSKVSYETLVSSAASKRAKLANPTSVAADGPRPPVSSTPSISSSIRPNNAHLQHPLAPDPSVDITRIRMRSQGHHCLYPGATFHGTQKSGRNSYDVTVSIVVR